MNKGFSLSLLALCAGSSLCALPAQSDTPKRSNPMVKTGPLPQTTFYHHPIQIQIVPEGPIVTEHGRPEEKQPNYKFQYTGQPNSAANAPTELLDGMQVGNPGMRKGNPMVRTAGTTPSRFGSNIPSTSPGGLGAGLPSGMSTNRLGNLSPNTSQAVTGRLGSINKPAVTAPRTLFPTAPIASSYQPYPTGGSGSTSGSTSASTRVKADLLNKHLNKLGK